MERILTLLKVASICATDERVLGDSIASLFRDNGLCYEREVRLDEKSRLDFLVGTVAVELKTKGGASDLIRQIFRYATSDRVSAIVVASTKYQHVASLPAELNGKPVRAVWVGAL